MKKVMRYALKLTYILIVQIALPVGIIMGSMHYAKKIIASKPKASRKEQVKSKVVVKTITVTPQRKRNIVSGYGTMQAYRRLSVRPQVSGNVVWQNPKLLVGQVIAKGEDILRIDKREFEIRYQQEQANLVRAQFELKVEEGNQVVAAREWELLGETVSSKVDSDLALRKPHLKEKQAAVMAAENSVKRAKLDLERTIIAAPFSAIVIDESVEVGQLVNSQNSIATVADVNAFWVRVNIPVEQLSQIVIPPSQEQTGSKARIIQNMGRGKPNVRNGHVIGILGDLDPQGRMARVLVKVDDALGRSSQKKPMLIGSYVKVDIQGKATKNLYKIPRYALHQNNEVWIKNARNQLEIRIVKVAFGNDDFIFVEGLKDNERVIVSNLSVAMSGMLLEEAGNNNE
ncbi:efflux RND transporter periplasmic adaptor subunit [Candidatus Uabimicrobium amorphum]|uniref:Hemolysin D n=1 Tax=Uabimicrobium amorphum TaxID=2596890 RepID=A0A5S9F257_UABAM|nr:efflux RND transporter periplasmic adaptor subunit [Candidatus Uabimicrobium amorphum]BBM83315.1 hemolysin D [Candidatus Uabimicrobium amorphum]